MTKIIYNDMKGNRIKNVSEPKIATDGMTFAVPNLTSDERDTLEARNGMIIYNTTTNQFNFYENNSWVTK